MMSEKKQLKSKWNHIERSLAVRGINGSGKLKTGTVILFAAAFFLIQSFWVLTDSIKQTLLNNRIERYGKWEYCISGRRGLAALDSYLDKTGSMKAAGRLSAGDNGNGVMFGYFDEQGLELAKLTLLEGTLPQNSGEVAMETEALNALGYPYELGCQLELSVWVKYTASDGVSEWVRTEEKNFKLCGILYPYSSAWSTAGSDRTPGALVTEEEAGRLAGGGEIAVSWLAMTKSEQDGEELEALFAAGETDGTLLRNDKTYPNDIYRELDGILRELLLCGVIIGLTVIFIGGSGLIRRQKRSWELLELLGANSVQVKKIMFWQCLCYLAAALPIGILSGIVGSTILIVGIEAAASAKFVVRIRPAGIGFSCICGILTYAAGGLAAAFWTGRNRGRSTRQKARGRSRRKRFRQLTRLNYIGILARTFLESPVITGIFTIVTALFMITFLLIAGRTDQSVDSYRYVMDIKESYRITGGNVSGETLEKLNSSPGITEIKATKMSDDFLLSIPTYARDSYYQTAADSYMKNNGSFLGAQDGEIAAGISVLAESESMKELLAEEYGLNRNETEQFFKGNLACIFLPGIYDEEGTEYFLTDLYDGALPKQLFLKNTDKIKKGDTMKLTYVSEVTGEKNRETLDIVIGAVKEQYRTKETITDNDLPQMPYGLLISEQALQHFTTYPQNEGFQNLIIYTDETASYETTDKVVSYAGRTAPKGGFVNYRIIREERFFSMLTELTGLLFLLVLLTGSAVMLFYFMAVLETDKVSAKIRIFLDLGMGRGKILLMYAGKGFLTGFAGAAAAAVIYFGILLYRGWMLSRTYIGGTVEYGVYLGLNGTDWCRFLLIACVCIGIQILIGLAASVKTIKNDGILNMMKPVRKRGKK